MPKCNICLNEFSYNCTLQRHLKEKRCKFDFFELHSRIEQLSLNHTVTNNIITNNNITNNNNNIQINLINMNPINKIEESIGYIKPEKMKELIEEYDINSSRINLLLNDYIKDILCHKDHPENHSVKYIKKHPPTYDSIFQDKRGNNTHFIKGLKDTCELLTDPILHTLKLKLQECLDIYQKDDFDVKQYKYIISDIKEELNKKNIKKILNGFLQNDLLNDIDMKLDM